MIRSFSRSRLFDMRDFVASSLALFSEATKFSQAGAIVSRKKLSRCSR